MRAGQWDVSDDDEDVDDSGALSDTGSSTSPWIALGALALIASGAAALAARRRGTAAGGSLGS